MVCSGWEILKIRKEVAQGGCGLLGFVNLKHLGLDPKDSMKPPETLKAGQGTGFCVHAKMLAADGSVDDT